MYICVGQAQFGGLVPATLPGPVVGHGLDIISRRAQSNGRHQPELSDLEPEAEGTAQAFTVRGGDKVWAREAVDGGRGQV